MHARWGVLNTDYWASLGWSDVRHRYRRTILGPIWLIMPLAVLVGAVGLLYAQIFGVETDYYIPYLTLGMIVWFFFSQAILDASGAFLSYSGVLHATRIQKSALICRVIFRHVIFLLHNLSIVVAVFLIFQIPLHWVAFASILSLVNTLFVVLGVSLALAPLTARYQDVQPMMTAILQLLFFLTPIIWIASESGARFWLYAYNPAYHLIEGFRAPLLDGEFNLTHYVVGAAVAAGAMLVGSLIFSRTEKYVTLWSN